MLRLLLVPVELLRGGEGLVKGLVASEIVVDVGALNEHEFQRKARVGFHQRRISKIRGI